MRNRLLNVMLYKMEPPLPPAEMYEQIQLYKKIFPTYPLTPAVTLEAVRTVKEHSFRYFDAQICATAKLNQIPVVLKEDCPVGATVEGVTVQNPPAEEFDLTDL
jgi:predicted nucleic acid-binding protein